MKRTFFALVLAAAAGGVFAQQYKWVDENGKVRYGDLPPAGVQATPLKPPPPGAATPAPEVKKDTARASTPGQGAGKRQEDAQKERETQARAEQDAQIKREDCARAQEVLRTMESGQRISRTDSKGERYYLDDAQIAQETAKARESVQQWCK